MPHPTTRHCNTILLQQHGKHIIDSVQIRVVKSHATPVSFCVELGSPTDNNQLGGELRVTITAWKISVHEFERNGLHKSMISTMDNQPFLLVYPESYNATVLSYPP